MAAFDEFISNPELMFACANWRGERTATLLLQVLNAVDKEDRDRYFAEPVTIEYAIHTQYHTIVKHPMDFLTMRNKLHANEYGTEVHAAVTAFRADFELTCANAIAFHRPNERCHIMARRMQRFGSGVIRHTFPSIADPAGDGGKGGKGGSKEGKADVADPKKHKDERESAAKAAEDFSAAPSMLESEWDYGAAVLLETADGATRAGDVCIMCGGAPCLLYTSPSPRDGLLSRMPSSA